MLDFTRISYVGKVILFNIGGSHFGIDYLELVNFRHNSQWYSHNGSNSNSNKNTTAASCCLLEMQNPVILAVSLCKPYIMYAVSIFNSIKEKS